MRELPGTPYGRRRVERLGDVPRADRPPTYYDRPALKASDWRWPIVTYMFVGGLAGAAQVIASVVDLLGHRRDRTLVSAGRYLALAGALLSPPLLIADLHVPSRWYNMMRIFRGTSAMSIGSWTLLVFGATSGVAAVGQLGADVLWVRGARTLARSAGIPAAAAGALLATYTGALLAATSTPVWAVSYRLLPALFGVSGMSTAIAALSLLLERTASGRSSLDRLARLSVLVSASELALMLQVDRVWRAARVTSPTDQPALAAAYRAGVLGLGIIAPLAVHLAQVLTGRELRRPAMLASLAALVGGFVLRAVVILAGKQSATRPTDYFRIAQPAHVAELTGEASMGNHA